MISTTVLTFPTCLTVLILCLLALAFVVLCRLLSLGIYFPENLVDSVFVLFTIKYSTQFYQFPFKVGEKDLVYFFDGGIEVLLLVLGPVILGTL